MLLRCALLVMMTVTSASGAWARQRLRADFQVNTYTTGGQQCAAVAADAQGGFLIAWSSVGQDGDGVGVFGQRFAPNGARLGVEFQINTYTTGHQSWFAYEKPVAAAGSNGYVLLWPSEGQDGSTWGIFGRRYDLNGAALGDEFQVNSVTTSDQRGIAVGVCPDDSFTVAWHDHGNDGSGWGVFGRRFDAAGRALGAQFVVPTATAGDQVRPAVACDANGTSLVLWTNMPGGTEIRGRRFDAGGQPASGELVISGHTPNGSENARVVPLPGGYVVTWERYDDTKVVVRRLDSKGAPVGAEVRVGQMGVIGGGFYGVAADATGAFAVAWSNGQDVFAQRFDATGAVRGAEFSVNATTLAQDAPVMTMDGDGNIMIAWESKNAVVGQDGDGKGVFARQFSSPRPSSLRRAARRRVIARSR